MTAERKTTLRQQYSKNEECVTLQQYHTCISLHMNIDLEAFNNAELISKRVNAAEKSAQGSLKSTLTYLYNDEGPRNLDRDRMLAAIPYLSPAEQIVTKWMQTRTNGSERKNYGAGALLAARKTRYRCAVCKFDDVRTLNIDHVDGRVPGTGFACLCANCHTIKSREENWTGVKVIV